MADNYTKEIKQAYLVLGYACNHNCSCCPCTRKTATVKFYDFKLIKKSIDSMKKNGINDITLSGGEPTVHPDFLRIIESLTTLGFAVNILTNGDIFSNKEFADKFIKIAENKCVTIITTFHSQDASLHEKENRTVGSHSRTLNGLRYLIENKITVSIKHCITNHNYMDLKKFVEFVELNFPKIVGLQLWGLDYTGLLVEDAKEMYVSFDKIQPEFEKAIDYFESVNNFPLDIRELSVNDLPLCMCDPYYWIYFNIKKDILYNNYTVPNTVNIEYIGNNSGTLSKNCIKCPVRNMCQGTYESAFEYFNDDIVAFSNELYKLTESMTQYKIYSCNDINLMFFSPYNKFYLTRSGLEIYNTVTMHSIILRAKIGIIQKAITVFSLGIEYEHACFLLNEFDLYGEGEKILKNMMLSGIVE